MKMKAMRKVCMFHILTLWMIGIFSLIIAQQGGGNIKKETEPINIDVVVRDATGKRLPDLKKEDFEIYEDGVLQEIALFKPAPHPLRLVLLFDTSVSMGAILHAIRDEAVNLVERLNQLDEIMIGAFDADLRWNTDWGGKALATSEILELKSTSNTQPGPPSPRPRLPSPFPIPTGGRRGLPDRNTNLFGAMHTLFGRFGGRSGDEVVVLFSDGKDSLDNNIAKQRPVKDEKQVIREAQRSWAQIYSACFKIERASSGTIPIGSRGYGSDCKLLSDIADATGGRSFEFDSRPDLAQILNKILDELKSQYTLAYYPSSQENRAGFHKIKVVVNKPEITTRVREGYLVSN